CGWGLLCGRFDFLTSRPFGFLTPGMMASLPLGRGPGLAAVGPDVLLPDWHIDLERVDQPAAGIKGDCAVAGGDGDGDRDLAQLQAAEAVGDGRVEDGGLL